jgi:tRNA nucleotidyltransferase (CCA-adding enzyme)
MTFPESPAIPFDVLEIVKTLEGAGHEAWCVGGALRDTILGEPNTDYDIATSATPERMQQLFKKTVAVGERFGTIAVRVSRRYHEVTTFRRDVQTDGRHAVVEFGATLEDDLARRDFTINAIAYHPIRQVWADPFKGMDDLGAGLVRAVGDASQRFAEDYLRVLRALRFAARFDFRIEDGTWQAVLASASGLTRLSAERVREEWFKGLRTTRSIATLVDLWVTSGAARVWLPELLQESADVRRQEVGASLAHPRNANLPRDPVLLTSLLCVSPVSVLTRLKASNAEVARAAAMVTGPDAPEGPGDVGARRWMAAVGDATEDLALLWQLRHGMPAPWADTVKGIRERNEATSRKQLAVTGNDLIAIGMAPGPQLGATLDRLLDLVLEQPALNTRDTLLAEARRTL